MGNHGNFFSKKLIVIVTLLMNSVQDSQAQDNASTPAAKKPLRAAIFVINRAGQELDEKIDTLNDLIVNRLTEKGFIILDQKEVAKPMKETREDTEQVKAIKRQLMDINVAMKKKEDDFMGGLSDSMDGASALRITQQIGADYVIIATLNSVGKRSQKTDAYGVRMDATENVMRIGLKVLDGVRGGSVYGDIVTVSEKKSGDIEVEDTDLINRLMDSAAVKVVENIETKVNRIANAKADKDANVPFQVNCNVERVDVLLDGAVIGSCGQKLNITPGLHAVEIRREWFRPWKRTVNIQADMVLEAQLELSDRGMEKYKEIKGFDLLSEKARADMINVSKLTLAEAYLLRKTGDAAVEEAKHPGARIKVDANLNINRNRKD